MKMELFITSFGHFCKWVLLADLLQVLRQFSPEFCSGTVLVDHIEGLGSASGCPSGPVCVQQAPAASEAQPGQYTQSPLPRSVGAHLPADKQRTQMTAS